MIIADSNKLNGVRAESVADYIAVLALSLLQSPDSCDPLTSILDLLTSGCGVGEAPRQITASDLAFLRALYHTNMKQTLWLEESDMVNNMRRQSDHRQ